MITKQTIQLMAAYAEWQNRNLFEAAGSISDAERRRDRGAFFGSIHGTLNHLLWGDQTWLHRLANMPAPAVPDIRSSVFMHEDWSELATDRVETDSRMLHWARHVRMETLDGNLEWYSSIVDKNVVRPKWALVLQLFNHGTHHRGQVHAMLTAAGAAPGDTDIQYMDSSHFSW